MIAKVFTSTLRYFLLTMLACGTVMAQDLRVAPGWRSPILSSDVEAPDSGAPFFTNLVVDPCTGCKYDSAAGGYYVWGVNNCESPGTTQFISVPFIASRSGIPSSIIASIAQDPACHGTSSEVTLGIWSDVCGVGPGTLLASGTATIPAAPCRLARATLQNAPSLVEGTKYWVAATTVGAAQDGLSAIWYASNTSQIGGNVANGGWFQFSGFVPGFGVRTAGQDH